MFKPIDVPKKLKALDKKRKMKYANKVLAAITEGDEGAMNYYAECIKHNFNFALKYYPRLNLFKSSSRKLIFNPMDGLATSYEWYNIARVFDGQMILNTYRYSVTTGAHVHQLASLFNELGIKYKTIEAPRGLQDLDSAMRRHTYMLAEAIVKDKHGRNSRSETIKLQKRKIKLVEKLSKGFNKFDECQLDYYIDRLERERKERLDAKRERNVA